MTEERTLTAKETAYLCVELQNKLLTTRRDTLLEVAKMARSIYLEMKKEADEDMDNELLKQSQGALKMVQKLERMAEEA